MDNELKRTLFNRNVDNELKNKSSMELLTRTMKMMLQK